MIVADLLSVRDGLAITRRRQYFYDLEQLEDLVHRVNSGKGFLIGHVEIEYATMYFFLSRISDEQEG